MKYAVAYSTIDGHNDTIICNSYEWAEELFNGMIASQNNSGTNIYLYADAIDKGDTVEYGDLLECYESYSIDIDNELQNSVVP